VTTHGGLQLPGWKGLQQNPPLEREEHVIRGRLILSNIRRSSLPSNTMSFYLLPKGIHKRMDNVKAKLFWRGASDEFRYHMVRWGAVCRPRNFGGLDIINTQIFGKCPMWNEFGSCILKKTSKQERACVGWHWPPGLVWCVW
jgi:hypothetical protein